MASPPALSHQTDREAQRGLHPGRLCGWKVLWSTRSTSCLPFSGTIPPNPQLIPRRRREHAGKACCHPEWVSLYPFYIHPFVAGWGPKVVVWLLLILVSWFVPNGSFIFWGNWIAPLGASSSVLSSSSTLPTRGRSPASRTGKTPTRISGSGSSSGRRRGRTGLMDGSFAGQACTLNQFVTTAKLLLCILVTVRCVYTAV